MVRLGRFTFKAATLPGSSSYANHVLPGVRVIAVVHCTRCLRPKLPNSQAAVRKAPGPVVVSRVWFGGRKRGSLTPCEALAAPRGSPSARPRSSERKNLVLGQPCANQQLPHMRVKTFGTARHRKPIHLANAVALFRFSRVLVADSLSSGTSHGGLPRPYLNQRHLRRQNLLHDACRDSPRVPPNARFARGLPI
eukprot:scaffold1875_cov253-Pinguiococcus_pyrenoidosus.AAC.26